MRMRAHTLHMGMDISSHNVNLYILIMQAMKLNLMQIWAWKLKGIVLKTTAQICIKINAH